MADEPSLGEIGRSLERLRHDLVEDITGIRQDIGRLVHLDVYTAHRLADQERMARLEQQAQQDQERRASDRRLIFASLIAPLVIVLIELYLAGRGAGP